MLSFFNKNQVESIAVNDIDNLIGQIELLDIREDYEYQSGSIKTAKNIPMGELLQHPERYMNKEKKYYILCQSGGRSGRVTGMLEKQGYQVVDVKGGMGSYKGSNRK
ncbi:MAG: rhodanese-like domain-containing protein [Cellulosilyticaceae bacterium]